MCGLTALKVVWSVHEFFFEDITHKDRYKVVSSGVLASWTTQSTFVESEFRFAPRAVILSWFWWLPHHSFIHHLLILSFFVVLDIDRDCLSTDDFEVAIAAFVL